MDQDSKIFHMHFPIQDISKAQGAELVLRSCDIVGVGSVRFSQLEVLKKSFRVQVLDVRNHISEELLPLYQEEFLRTLTWLRPSEVLPLKIDFQKEQKKLFSVLFSKTAHLLGDMATRICDLYLAEMPTRGWLLQDHWRYFTGFLRQQWPDKEDLLQVSYWEWVEAWLDIQNLSGYREEPNLISINPSFQPLRLDPEAATLLNLPPGLYGCVFNQRRKQKYRGVLTPAEALLIDLLAEELKFSRAQLLDLASLEMKTINREDWENVFLSLQDRDILREKPGQ
jgi:hypothetical protein